MISPTLNYVKNRIFLFFGSHKGIILLLIAAILPVNSIFQLLHVHNWEHITVLDGVIYQFGLNTLYYLVVCPSSLYLVYDICKPDSSDVYLFIRIGRKRMIIAKIYTLVGALMLYFTILVLCSLLVLSCSFSSVWQWGQSFINSNGFNGVLISKELFKYSPIVLVCMQLLYVFLSTLSTGLMLLLLTEIIPHKPVAFACVMMYNFLLLILSKLESKPVYINPVNNTFLAAINAHNLPHSFWYPIIYWIITIGCLVFVNHLILNKKDYIYGSSFEDDT